jgi:hypothetical protein
VAEDEAVEDGAKSFLLFGVEAADGFKLQAEFIVRATLVFAEQQTIGGSAESDGKIPDHVEGGLRRTCFVSFQLLNMDTDKLGELLLGQASLMTKRGQTPRKVVGRLMAGHKYSIRNR